MSHNETELKMGEKVEMEHTKDQNLASKIANDHLQDDPRYYSKLMKAGLADELGEDLGTLDGDLNVGDMVGAVSIVSTTPMVAQAPVGQSPLQSSNLGCGSPKPLKSDNLGSQAPKGNNSIGQIGKTPPKMPEGGMSIGQNFGTAVPISNDGTIKANNVRIEKTPSMPGENTDCDPMNYYGGKISSALKAEIPRTAEMIPANIYEGGSQLKKVTDAHAGLTDDMAGRWTINAFDTSTANKNETPPMKEIAYKNNAGVMEVMKFYQTATPQQEARFEALVNSGKEVEAWDLVQDVTGTKLQGDGPWNPRG